MIGEVWWAAVEKQVDADHALGQSGVVVEDAAVADVEQASRPGNLAIDRAAIDLKPVSVVHDVVRHPAIQPRPVVGMQV